MHCCVVSSSYALFIRSEQLWPVAAINVTELAVVFDHHVAITDLLQRTQAEMFQVCNVYGGKTDGVAAFVGGVKRGTLVKGEVCHFYDINMFDMQRTLVICKLT